MLHAPRRRWCTAQHAPPPQHCTLAFTQKALSMVLNYTSKHHFSPSVDKFTTSENSCRYKRPLRLRGHFHIRPFSSQLSRISSYITVTVCFYKLVHIAHYSIGEQQQHRVWSHGLLWTGRTHTGQLTFSLRRVKHVKNVMVLLLYLQYVAILGKYLTSWEKART